MGEARDQVAECQALDTDHIFEDPQLLVARAREIDSLPEVETVDHHALNCARFRKSGRLRAKAVERSSQLLRAAREVGAVFEDPALEQAEAELNTLRKRTPTPDSHLQNGRVVGMPARCTGRMSVQTMVWRWIRCYKDGGMSRRMMQ